MEIVHRLRTVVVDQVVNAVLNAFLGGFKFRGIGRNGPRTNVAREVVADGVRQNEVAVREALHEGRSAQTVGSVIGEIRLASGIQAGHRSHEVVVHPQSTHRVVHRGVNLHGCLVRIVRGNLLVHVKQVAILRLHHLFPEFGDFGF